MKKIKTKKIPKSAIYAWISCSSLAIVAVLTYVAIKYNEDVVIISLLWTFVGVVLSGIVSYVTEKYADDSSSFCAYKEHVQLGILKIYKSIYCDEYTQDLGDDLDNLDESHYSEENPVKFIAASLKWCLIGKTDNNVIQNKINHIAEKAYFHFYMCSPDNRELLWRKNQIDRLNGQKGNNMFANQENIISNIVETEKILKALGNQFGKHVKYKQYKDASPFATICIVNDHIYYAPNLFRFVNWRYGNNSANNEIRPSFLILRNSPFGRRIEELFQNVYTLDHLS